MLRGLASTMLLLALAFGALSCIEEGSPAGPPSGSGVETGSVTDFEGHVYRTVKIGGQWWMAENLKATKYNNGDLIPNTTEDAAWTTLTTPAFAWYQNDAATYGTVYGALYNWYVVDRGSNGGHDLCPTGWHVPTATDWTTLTDALGGLDVAGGKMKEAGTSHWSAPNTEATNTSGFTGLPGGHRGYANGAFQNVGLFAHWWSGTESDAELAWGEGLFSPDRQANHSTSVKQNGFSVRCVES